MDWLQITSALFVLAMIVFLFPRMLHAVKNSPKGTRQDWMSFIIPMVLVALFIVILIKMV